MFRKTRVSPHNTVVMAAFILSLLVLAQSAVDLYLPSMPHMTGALKTTGSRIQQSVTFYMLTYAYAPLVIGPLSDRFGRRPVLLAAVAVYIAGALGSALSQSVGWLLWMRALNGVGGGGIGTFSRAIMRDVFEGVQLRRISAYQVITWAVVPILAPVAGGYIQAGIGWRANFFVIAALGATLWLVAFFILPETKDMAHRQPFRFKVLAKNYWHLLSDRLFIGYAGAIFLFYGAFIAFDVASPFLLQTQLGLSPPSYGWMMLIVGASLMAGAALSIRLAHRVAIESLMWPALTLSFAATLLFLGLGLFGVFSIVAIIAPFCFFAFSMGIIWPNASAALMQRFPTLSGSAAAMIVVFASTGGAITSYVMARLPEHNQIPLGWVEVTLVLLCICCLGGLALRREGRSDDVET